MLKFLLKRSLWNWLLWWRADHENINRQADDASRRRGLRSYRGLGVFFLIFDTVLGAFVILGNGGNAAVLAAPAVMLVLALLVWRGYRLAMIAAMLAWTLEKSFQCFVQPGFILVAFPVWAIPMHAFYMALLVEQRRANAEPQSLHKGLAALLGRAGAATAAGLQSSLTLPARKARG